jgi:hypothetical protein
MSTIIAGRFCQQTEVQEAAEALMRAGFDENRISSFYMGPIERHPTASIPEHRYASAGAEHTPRGIATGGAIGAAVGAIASPLAGPAGPAGGALLGAHLGNLIGTLSQTEEADHSPPIRHPGMMIAVEIADPSQEPQAIDVLRALGAEDLERADGVIEDGDWRDFDAASTPHFLDSATH